jgi:2-polyprenyl-3-methyl-5-hydroxy-6-metoxy-1,4-benzoquinol methylase
LETPLDANSVFPEVRPSDVDRWDREWMHYFATENRHVHLVEHRKLAVIADLAGRSARDVFYTSLTRQRSGEPMLPLHVWAEGDDLVGKKVLEIGCGCGWLGKQLGMVSEAYVGIDYSEFALAVGRGNSPANCRYLHISERDDIAALAGQMDIMVGREFFIHQNFENASWVLRLGAFLLKPGGIVSADFYLADPKIPQGVVHPAKSPLDPVYASCAFAFRPDEIAEVARNAGLEVVASTDHLEYQRRFVRMRKLS